jgi:hypothetical protein
VQDRADHRRSQIRNPKLEIRNNLPTRIGKQSNGITYGCWSSFVTIWPTLDGKNNEEGRTREARGFSFPAFLSSSFLVTEFGEKNDRISDFGFTSMPLHDSEPAP